MKKILSVVATLACCAVLTISCKKGDTGPAGAAGPEGNANVTVFNYGAETFTGSVNYPMSNVSRGKIDSCFILAYYNPSTEAATSWYPIPGTGPGGAYETRSFLYQTSVTPSNYSLGVRLLNPGGSVSYPNVVTFTKFRIFLVPASSVLPGGRTARPADFSNYHSVCAYYKIPE